MGTRKSGRTSTTDAFVFKGFSCLFVCFKLSTKLRKGEDEYIKYNNPILVLMAKVCYEQAYICYCRDTGSDQLCSLFSQQISDIVDKKTPHFIKS